MDLKNKKCVPCEGNVEAFTREEATVYLAQTLGWTLSSDAKRISREFTFSSEAAPTSRAQSPFKKVIEFVNKIADLAESEGHHPDMKVSYDKVIIELWTHAVDGLSENDFILAAKINQISH